MKFSKYNTSVYHEDKFVFFNAYTENFLLLEPFLMDLINASIAEDNLKGLAEIHPDLYSSLLNSGFIVPEEENELEKVKMLIKETDINDELFSLMVLPTMNCNFKCWYCYESHIKGSKMQEPALNKIKLLLNNKFNTMQNMKNFHLSYFGGEPLLYFDDVVLPTLRHTYNLSKQHNISLFTHFTTNGFLINDYVMENLVKYEVNSFQITFDGNKENHNKVRYVSKTRGSYDGIVSNIKRLVRSNIKVSLRINYTNDNIDGLYDILDSFQDLSMDNRKKITLHMQRVWQEKKTEGLFQKSRQVSDKFNEFGFQLPNPKALNTLRQSCYADKKYQAAINYNGDVFKCNARDFKKENREGILNDKGEIEWNAQFYDRMSIKLKNKPCQECSIMPICGGACSQYALERKNEDFCIHDFDEKSKKNVILEMFLNGDHTRV